MGCREFSELYMKLINGLVLVLSLVILGFGAYLAATVGGSLKDVDLNDPVTITLVFGGFMFILSLIGIVGAVKDSKFLIFIYIIGTLVLGLGTLAVGIVLLFYGGYLDDVRDGDVEDKIQSNIVHFELAAFEVCCGPFTGGLPAADCVATAGIQPCVSDSDKFNDFKDAIGDANSATCDLLERADVVGEVADGKCGSGLQGAFVDDCTEFFEENLQRLAIADITIGVLLILLLGTSCYILWTRDDNESK